MKRIFIVLYLFISLFFLVCCNNTEKYELVVHDNFNLILNKLGKYYEPGDIVEVKTPFYSGMEPGINVDGEKIEISDYEEWDYYLFKFIMPEHDAVLYTTMNGLRCVPCSNDEHQYVSEVIEDTKIYTLSKLTCSVCWAEKITKEYKPTNTYSLSFTGKIEYLISEHLTGYNSNSLIEVETTCSSDKYIELYVNGEKINVFDYSEKRNTYLFEFKMPAQDSIVEIREVDFIPLKEIEGYEWIKDLKLEEIAEVSLQSATFAFSLNAIAKIIKSTDFDDIENIYNFLNDAEFRLSSAIESADGGGYIIYEVILKDGKKYSLRLTNGELWNSDYSMYIYVGNYCGLKNITDEYYSFIKGWYKIYNSNNEMISQYSDLDKFVFEFSEDNLPSMETQFYLETNWIDKICIISSDYFYIEENDKIFLFKITGNTNFSFLFE